MIHTHACTVQLRAATTWACCWSLDCSCLPRYSLRKQKKNASGCNRWAVNSTDRYIHQTSEFTTAGIWNRANSVVWSWTCTDWVFNVRVSSNVELSVVIIIRKRPWGILVHSDFIEKSVWFMSFQKNKKKQAKTSIIETEITQIDLESWQSASSLNCMATT